MTQIPDEERGLGRRALLRNGLWAGAGAAVLSLGAATLPSAAQAAAVQDNWRWCVHCEGLWWAGNADNGQQATPLGICPFYPAGEDQPHTPGNTNYLMPSGFLPSPTSQAGWRWCVNCYVLFWGAGLARNGVCPIDAPHVAGGSIYDMYHDVLLVGGGGGQGGWDWCGKCQGLYWGNGHHANGNCPAGGAHTPGSTTNYVVGEE